jgi:hypothetical protein
MKPFTGSSATVSLALPNSWPEYTCGALEDQSRRQAVPARQEMKWSDVVLVAGILLLLAVALVRELLRN